MRVPQLPAALHWSHNTYYHRWLLKQVPIRPSRVLDAGCGSGKLACILAARAAHVDAVDVSPLMIERGRTRCPAQVNVNWLVGDLVDPHLPLTHGGYDAVVAVSSVHHMPLRSTLSRLADLVAPGGVLAIVGLYRPVTITDHVLQVVAMPANAAVGAVCALSGRADKSDDADMPVRPPENTLAQVRAAADEMLPGAHLRRAVFWRYLMLWRRPPSF
ncbi:MAG: class I SAM-dependent methyltransferase [Propionibacteriales bacterium]|nr:class I SAM-dependent methyltransferase [Propionibacteriales bacterium]